MSYDNAKTWIKIAIPLGLLLIGFVIGCFSFRDKPDHNSTIQYLEQDRDRALNRLDSVIAINWLKDSIAAKEIIRQDSIIENIKQDANTVIKKGINDSYYNELVESNRSRGRQRFSN